MENIQSLSAAKYDIVIDANADNVIQFYIWADAAHTVPVNLTGYSADCQVKNSRTGSVLATFTCTIPAPQTAGCIQLSMPLATASALQFSGKAFYDVRIYKSGVYTRVIEGAAQLSKGVTL